MSVLVIVLYSYKYQFIIIIYISLYFKIIFYLKALNQNNIKLVYNYKINNKKYKKK